jgi:hypothetical protein
MESWYNARTVLDSPHRNLLECFSKNDSFLDYAENWGLIVMPKRLASTVIFLLTTSLKEEEARYKKDIDLLRAAFGDKNCLHKIVQLGQIRNRALALPRFFHLVIPKLAILSGEDGIEPENLVSYFGDNFMGAFKIVLQNQMKQAGFPDTARFVQWAKEIVFWAIYSRTIFGQHAFKPKHAAIASEYMKPVIISKNPQSLYFEAMKPEADAPWHPYHSYWQATEGVVDLLFEKMSFGSDL